MTGIAVLAGLFFLLTAVAPVSSACASAWVTVELDSSLTPAGVSYPASFGIQSIDVIGVENGIESLTPLLANWEALLTLYPQEARTFIAEFATQAAAEVAAAQYSEAEGVASSFVSSCEMMRYYSPTDTYYANQWMLENTGQFGGDGVSDLDAESAWEFTSGDTNVVVAVIDGEILQTHTEFVHQLWNNPDEPAGNGDDDGNGYADDFHGFHFSTGTNNTSSGDTEPHGTSVAGALIARRNGAGTVGVAYGCRLMTLGASQTINPGNGGLPFDEALRAAYIYAAENGARVISCSIGCIGIACANAVKHTIKSIMAAHPGLVICEALGNAGVRCDSLSNGGGNPQSDVTGVLAVGNVGYDGTRNYSIRGYPGAVMAPAGGGPPNGCPDQPLWTFWSGDNAYTDFFGGSSGATPMVAGIAALLVSDDPALQRTRAKDIIVKSCIDVLYDRDAPSSIEPLIGPDDYAGSGVANAHRALLFPWVYWPDKSGRSYAAGDTMQIKWRKPKTNTSLCSSKVELVSASGVVLATVATGRINSTAPDLLVWTVPPGIQADAAKIRITNSHTLTGGTPSARDSVVDMSDVAFRVNNPLSGIIASDTTWSGRAVVVGDITIPSGKTLTIAPGTQVEFASSDALHGGADTDRCEVLVYGRLRGAGTSSSRVAVKAGSGSSAAGVWYSIRNLAGGEVDLKYCDLANAETCITAVAGAESLKVEACTFRAFESAAVVARGAFNNSGCNLSISATTVTVSSDDVPFGIYCAGYLRSARVEGTEINTGGVSASRVAYGFWWDAEVTNQGAVPRFVNCSSSGLQAGVGFGVGSGGPEFQTIDVADCSWGVDCENTAAPTISGNSVLTRCNAAGLYAAWTADVSVDSTEIKGAAIGAYLDEYAGATLRRLLVRSSSAGNPDMSIGIKSYASGTQTLRASEVRDFINYGAWASSSSLLDLGTSASHGNNWIRETGSESPVRFIGAESRASGLGPLQAKYNCYSDSSSTRFDAAVEYQPTDCDNVGELGSRAELRQVDLRIGLRVHPNPSSGAVEILLAEEGEGRKAPVMADVFDLAGRRVARVPLLWDGAGFQGFWDGRMGDRGELASRGIYFVKVTRPHGVFAAKIHRIW